jgi:Uma2 family endonuclease
MGATTTLVTVREFLELPEPEGQRMELIGGEVVTMGRGGIPHEVVKSNVARVLTAWLLENPIGAVFNETMFQLDERNCLIPDVSVLRPGHIPRGGTGSIQGAPEIAIEVVSSETAVHLENKIELYLAYGSKSVWVVFPEQRIVRVFDGSGQSRKFEQNQILEDAGALPGFRVPVAAIFEDL